MFNGNHLGHLFIKCYAPSWWGLPLSTFDSLEEIAKLWMLHASTELLIMGDLNLDRLSDSSSIIKEQCLELNLFRLIDKSTRPNIKNPLKFTLIDIVLTHHCPIKTKSQIFTTRNYKHFNIQVLK